MNRAKRDDEVAWLIAQEIPRLRRYAAALTHDRDAVDDLVQDCLERAIRKRHQWRRHSSVRNWLYRILYTIYLNQKPRRDRTRRQVPLEGMAVPPSIAASQELHTACRDIADAMQMLPPDQRAAIVLTALEGLSYDEAARVMDIPIGTLRSRLSRGREQLRVLYVQPGEPVKLKRIK